VQDVSNQKIRINQDNDKLRWGYMPRGTFTIKESYQLLIPPMPDPPDPGWAKLWALRTWPKISIFLWQVLHRRILTWDNILKRGFSGPSRCVLCNNNEESIDHLLNNCTFSNNLWDKATILYRISDRIHGDITHTLKNWADSPYQNPILNHLWQFLPGFLVWNIWKEHNRHIFEDKSSSEDSLWTICKKQLLETILLHCWSDLDFKAPTNEALLLQRWDIHPDTLGTPPPSTDPRTRAPHSPDHWCPPPSGFLKLNFDGASKGNPGPAGFGGVFHTNTRELFIFITEHWAR
jgi:hypothetical protein